MTNKLLNFAFTPNNHSDYKLVTSHLHYSINNSPFGLILIASTKHGVCLVSMAFEKQKAVESLLKKYPHATIEECKMPEHDAFMSFFDLNDKKETKLSIHLTGTIFQMEVWKELTNIPFGQITSYSQVAENIGNPKANRAVGTAIGKNPIFFVIPCHRVIKSTGEIGNYYWGNKLKTEILNWEKDQLK